MIAHHVQVCGECENSCKFSHLLNLIIVKCWNEKCAKIIENVMPCATKNFQWKFCVGNTPRLNVCFWGKILRFTKNVGHLGNTSWRPSWIPKLSAILNLSSGSSHLVFEHWRQPSWFSPSELIMILCAKCSYWLKQKHHLVIWKCEVSKYWVEMFLLNISADLVNTIWSACNLW